MEKGEWRKGEGARRKDKGKSERRGFTRLRFMAGSKEKLAHSCFCQEKACYVLPSLFGRPKVSFAYSIHVHIMDISVIYVQKMYIFGHIAIKCPKHTYVIAKAIRKVSY